MSPAKARNIGAIESKTSWLLFIDSDCSLPKESYSSRLVKTETNGYFSWLWANKTDEEKMAQEIAASGTEKQIYVSGQAPRPEN